MDVWRGYWLHGNLRSARCFAHLRRQNRRRTRVEQRGARNRSRMLLLGLRHDTGAAT